MADEAEVGVFDVTLTEEARGDRLMAGLAPSHKVMQWHFAEVKRAPEAARVMAGSRRAAIQSLAVDAHALTTQFHCEFSPQSVAGWSSLPNYVAALEKHLGPGAYPRLMRESYPLMPAMARMTRQMYENFKASSGLRP